MITKQKLRKKILSLREAQPANEKAEKDALIMRRLETFDLFAYASEFFTYIPYRGEVNTMPLIKKYFGKKKIIVPKVKGQEICLCELKNPDVFRKGAFGISEPRGCLPQKELPRIEIVLVPGVAFDKNGFRIGFGGGFFDRFLPKIHCTTIGLAYEFQIIDKAPGEFYDVPVEWIITEKRIIDCKHISNE